MQEMPLTVAPWKQARLHALLQALLGALEDERDESRPSDYALMRALLFRIGMELQPADADRPARAEAAAAPRGLPVDHAPAGEHLHDIEQALTALEVLGGSHRLAFRTQALLFVEWQLARLDRLDPRRGLTTAVRVTERVETRRAPPSTVAAEGRGPVESWGSPDELRDRRLLRDSLARAGVAARGRRDSRDVVGMA